MLLMVKVSMAKLAVTVSIRHDVGVGAGVGSRAVTPVHEVVASVGDSRDWRAICTVVDRLRSLTSQGATRSSRVAQGELTRSSCIPTRSVDSLRYCDVTGLQPIEVIHGDDWNALADYIIHQILEGIDIHTGTCWICTDIMQREDHNLSPDIAVSIYPLVVSHVVALPIDFWAISYGFVRGERLLKLRRVLPDRIPRFAMAVRVSAL